MNQRRNLQKHQRCLLMLVFFLTGLPAAFADVVHLKKDQNLTGKVIDNGADSITLEIPHGTLKVEKSDIEWIIYGTDAEIEDKRLAAGCFDKGQYFFSILNFEEAAKEFQKALDLVPDDANILNNLGACYARLRDYPAAIGAYERALKSKPGHKTAAQNLAQVFIEAGAYRKAEHILRKMAVKGPPDALTYLLLGVVFYKNSRYTQAKAFYEKALYMMDPADPQIANIYNNLGCCNARLYLLDEASYSYQKALELKPSHFLANYNMKIVTQAKEKVLAKAVK